MVRTENIGGSEGDLDFDWLEGCLISETSWTHEEIDEMCSGRLMAQFAYWKNNPPLHLMVKAFLRIEDEELEEVPNVMEATAAVQMLRNKIGPVEKVSKASPLDRERFERLKRNAG